MHSIQHHLEQSSIHTYTSGLNAFDEFAAVYNLPRNVFTVNSVNTIQHIIQYYLSYLRLTRHIQSSTIDNYLSHLMTYLHEQGVPTTSFRSREAKFMLSTWEKEDFIYKPERLRVRFPVSTDLLWRIFDMLDTWYILTPIYATIYKAAFATGYGLSLRPSEYLEQSLYYQHVNTDDDVATLKMLCGKE